MTETSQNRIAEMEKQLEELKQKNIEMKKILDELIRKRQEKFDSVKQKMMA